MRALLLATAVTAAACSRGPVAVLTDAAGVDVGSRVFAEGVAVGTVKKLEVQDARVRLELQWSEGRSVALRADACAVALPARPADVLLFPGKDLEPLGAAIPGCRDDLLLRTRVRAVSLGSTPGLSESAASWLEARRRDVPLREPCDALEVSKLRVEQVDAVPVLLPGGGLRVWLALENRSDAPLSLSTARFVDARGVEAPHAHLPDDDALFMSLSLPPRTRREVSAVFADPRSVSAVEFEAQVPEAPGGTCRSRWRF